MMITTYSTLHACVSINQAKSVEELVEVLPAKLNHDKETISDYCSKQPVRVCHNVSFMVNLLSLHIIIITSIVHAHVHDVQYIVDEYSQHVTPL